MSYHNGRYVYDSTRTRREAELVLEDYFASGEICEAEHPIIQQRTHYCSDGTTRTDWDITLPLD